MKEILSRVNENLLFLVLIVIVLFFGKPVIVPIILGALLAMLMAPVCATLDERGFHRALSTTVCILILIVALLLVFYIIGAQISSFAEDINEIEKKGRIMLGELQGWIEDKFNINKERQETIAKEQVENGEASGGGIASSVLSGFTTTLTTLVLMLVYTFLFLFGREKYETFVVRMFPNEDTEKVKTIVGKISLVGQKYLTGRAMSVMILATLYSLALLLIGLENAILLAGIAALLTIVPYVGTTIGGLFPFMVALITEDSYQPALMVAIAIVVIQTIDNYFIEPNVVGGEVNLSAFASIFSIVAGGIIWGVAGMILFLPIMGIMKIIFDHVESLKPIGFVIGDNRMEERTNPFRRILEKLGLRKNGDENKKDDQS